MTQKITPFLWFDTQAEEAANFYVSLFKDSRIVSVSRYTEEGPGVPGSAMTVEFELDGVRFVALNGGPYFKFTEAISLSIDCADQAEIDYYWSRLTDGGEESQCGWLKDRYGLSWQVVPSALQELLSSGDAETARKVTAEMLTMKKLDIARLRAAAGK
jgi:predicted 3-demethylubiquinone-9 3-methyltransferase (glyoxalase superfamily)